MTAPDSILFPFIPFILVLTCLICSINLYLNFKRNSKDLFGCLINAFTMYLLINSLFVWIVECFFVNDSWINRMFPFIFMYGPFFYFFNRVLKGRDLSLIRLLLHSIPFIIFTIVFIIYAYNGWYNDVFKYDYFMSYKVNASVVSLIAYCSYGFFNRTKLVGKLIDKRAIVLFGIMMLFITIYYVVISSARGTIFENSESTHLYRLTIYCIMLVVAILIFGYQTMPIIDQYANEELEFTMVQVPNKEPLPKYEKSVLTESQIDAYGMILNDVVKTRKLFLKQELSLAELALEVKIPTHHLTEVLNTKLEITFHNYINYQRVSHACELMTTPTGMKMSLEELGSLSGFNSRASFNRNFKYWMHCSPSEYRKRLI